MPKQFLQHPDNVKNPEWWRGASIYQIYPRSYQDSNGDGIGDLKGIIERLPYVAELGVDAVWLSPFFTSPMKDFGYDVSDYCDVDPMFGTLDDFKQLVARAHELGLRVIIDQVLSHTSDQHAWFKESRQSRDNPKADWYVWADAKSDGSVPNNWLSIFIGSAWQWDSKREQYYFHNFLTSQPDLNLHHPQVRQALFDVARFWLDIGVDGFRLDTVNFYIHDAQLRDNPGRGRPICNDSGVVPNNPYSWQTHLYDKSQPENLQFLREFRAVLNEYPGITTIGEIGDEHPLVLQAQYTGGGDKLHTAYSFSLLAEQNSADHFYRTFTEFEQAVSDGWACWSFANHDVKRVASRWSDDPRALRLYASLLMTLRGSPCFYQGEELGLTEAKLTFEQLQDPYGISMWPEEGGRDGCRTPMVWDSRSPNAGFSQGKPWLPIAPEHMSRAVSEQDQDPNSLLNFYRRWFEIRRVMPILWSGTIEFLPPDERVFTFIRSDGTQRLLCVFNLSDQACQYVLPQHCVIQSMAQVPQQVTPSTQAEQSDALKTVSTQDLQLSPWQTLFAWVDVAEAKQ